VGFSVGLGLTNECNLGCPHCYRDTGGTHRLNLPDVAAIFRAIEVSSVNLGYGENGMHPEFHTIVQWLTEQPCQLTMTSNGHSVRALPDDLLRHFTDVELSLDFPDAERQDAWRGPGNHAEVLAAIRRCRSLDVPVTVLAVMMQTNYCDLVDIGRVAFAEGASYRVNAYQPVWTDEFALSYDEYWEAFRRLLAAFALEATSEPVLAAALSLPDFQGCGCGRSTVRVTPAAAVVPCTYWPAAGTRLPNLGPDILQTPAYVACRQIPAACSGCAFEQTCAGGCAGRRAVAGSLDQPDPYCRLVRGDAWPYPVRRASDRDRPKSRSACTTIFAP